MQDEVFQFTKAKFHKNFNSEYNIHNRIEQFAYLTHRMPYLQMPQDGFLVVQFDEKLYSKTPAETPSAILRSEILGMNGDGVLKFKLVDFYL